MSPQLQSQVRWRKGLKSPQCVLIGGQTLKLQKEDGEVVFDLTRDQITKVRIQREYIYINVRSKVYSVSVMPEAQRLKQQQAQGDIYAIVDTITHSWRDYFNTSPDGVTKPIKVRRLSGKTLGYITAIVSLIVALLSLHRN